MLIFVYFRFSPLTYFAEQHQIKLLNFRFSIKVTYNNQNYLLFSEVKEDSTDY